MVGRTNLETLDVPTAVEWRAWLRENHLSKEGVWLVFYRAGSGTPSISYGDALDEALAYGWIDSIIKKLDECRYVRKFTPRRPGSIWSKLNLERASVLVREGRMAEWGMHAYEKRTGEPSLLDQFNAGRAPPIEEFEAALRKNRKAWSNYRRMSPSQRKRYLLWISGAKRLETRHRRMAEAVLLVEQNVRNLLK